MNWEGVMIIVGFGAMAVICVYIVALVCLIYLGERLGLGVKDK